MHRLEKWLRRMVWSAYRRPRIVFGVSLLFFLAVTSQLPHLVKVIKTEDQVDPLQKSYETYETIRKNFGADPDLQLILKPKSAENLCAFTRDLAQVLRDFPGIYPGANTFNLRRAQIHGTQLYYGAIVPSPCAPDFKLDQISQVTHSIWSSLYTDPQGQSVVYDFYLAPLKERALWGTYDHEQIDSFFEKMETALGGWEYHWTGNTARYRWFKVGMEKSDLDNGWAALILILLFKLILGTWSAGFIYVGLQAFTFGLVMGGMAIIGHPVDILTLCIAVLMTLACVEDFVFLSYDMKNRGCSLRSTLLRLALPSFFTSLTTFVGFASLGVADFSSIRRFATWSAIGSIIEWIAVFFVLPAVLNTFRLKQKWVRAPFAPANLGILARIEKLVYRCSKINFPFKATIATLIISSALILAQPASRLQQDPVRSFPASHPYRKSVETLREKWGWSAVAAIYYEPQAKSALEATREKLRAKFQSDPLVHRWLSSADVLNDVQSEITKIPPEVLSAHDRELLVKHLDAEVTVSPDWGRFVGKNQDERDFLLLKSTNTYDVDTFRQKLEAACPAGECNLSGEIVLFAEGSQKLMGILFESFAASFFSVAALLIGLCWVLKHRPVWPLLISSLWGPLLLTAFLLWSGIELNSVTCIVIATVMGLTGDNAIHYLFFEGKSRARAGQTDIEEGVNHLGPASITNLTLAVALSLVFVGSYFEPPRYLGFLLALGCILCTMGDVWVLRGILDRNKSVDP